MVQIALLILIPLLALWVQAERRWGMPARVGLGVASIVATAMLTYELARFGPRHESRFHRTSLQLVGELIAVGDTQRVQEVIATYNAVAATNSTYRASMEMRSSLLRHGPEK